MKNADEFLDRLGHTHWYKGRIQNDLVPNDGPLGAHFFDADGNRQADTGEYVIWLKPVFDGTRNLPEASITVWCAGGEKTEKTWRTFTPPLHVFYDRSDPEENYVHVP